MSPTTPESVWNLRQSIQAKAKAHPTLRFYRLYDKIYRRDVLAFAWQRCRAKGGSAGVDGQTFEQIESEGLGRWLNGLTDKAYRAVDSHTRHRLRQWLVKKHKKAGAGTGAYPDEYLDEKLGLLRLEKLTANLPWAKA